MGKRSEQRIVPVVGMVIEEDDPRVNGCKRIVSLGRHYVMTQAGLDGTGRRAAVSVRRLLDGRYRLISGGEGS
jgi:hypothetical protein